jgi:hypothetical protein
MGDQIVSPIQFQLIAPNGSFGSVYVRPIYPQSPVQAPVQAPVQPTQSFSTVLAGQFGSTAASSIANQADNLANTTTAGYDHQSVLNDSNSGLNPQQVPQYQLRIIAQRGAFGSVYGMPQYVRVSTPASTPVQPEPSMPLDQILQKLMTSMQIGGMPRISPFQTVPTQMVTPPNITMNKIASRLPLSQG